ncbi:MAG: adenylate kinase [Anaerofustis stercorihominis]|nr:adenylate kinase [Anaerofustis stercorihominis]
MNDKIIVIGCPGSGKSTFSRKLSEKINIPVYHLDNLYWNPDKTTVSSEIFDQRLSEVMKKDRWIIDGNFSRTLEVRLSECDTVFFLDLPADICLQSVRDRIGTVREDIPWVETEEDEEFMDYIRSFQETNIPVMKALFEKYPDKEYIVFKDRCAVQNYIESI